MILAVLAYGALLLYADAGAIAKNASQVPVWVLLAATGLAIANFIFRFFRWQYYLRRLDISVPTFDSGLIFIAGFSMSITPGKVGEVIKSLLLKRAHDVSMAVSAPIVLAERITDLGALLLLGAVGLLAIGSFWSAIAAVLLVLLMFVLCVWRPLSDFGIRIATKIPFLARRKQKLLELQASILALNQPVPFTISLFLSFIAWGAQCLNLKVIASAFPGMALSLQEAFLAYSAPLLAGTLALIPGGLGVTEGSMTGVLQTLGGDGVTAAAAAAATILCRLTTFWVAILFGFVALGIWRSRHGNF